MCCTIPLKEASCPFFFETLSVLGPCFEVVGLEIARLRHKTHSTLALDLLSDVSSLSIYQTSPPVNPSLSPYIASSPHRRGKNSPLGVWVAIVGDISGFRRPVTVVIVL